MANLLSKLRIDYSSLTMVQGIFDKPKTETIILHQNLLKGFMEGQNKKVFVTETELKQLEEKTYRHLRLREMMLKHSSQATLIVMSMPIPRQVISYNFLNSNNLLYLILLGNCFSTTLYVMARYSYF